MLAACVIAATGSDDNTLLTNSAYFFWSNCNGPRYFYSAVVDFYLEHTCPKSLPLNVASDACNPTLQMFVCGN
jgi:hypothetical protein